MFITKRLKCFVFFLIIILATTHVVASELSFGTQPRGSHAEAEKAFQELLDYLSTITGASVGLHYTDNWLAYANNSRNDRFDITYDGAALVSWRMHKKDHDILVQVDPVNGVSRHVVVVKKDNDRVHTLGDLVARTICGRPSPNLATLVLLNEFENPLRQPVLVSSLSYGDAYRKFLANECEAVVIGETAFNNHPEKEQGRVVFTSKGVPPAAITAGPRVTSEQKRKIVEALTSPEATSHIGGFLKKYANDRPFVLADPAKYMPHYILFRNEWGFGD